MSESYLFFQTKKVGAFFFKNSYKLRELDLQKRNIFYTSKILSWNWIIQIQGRFGYPSPLGCLEQILYALFTFFKSVVYIWVI